jgi:hypothetical protein
MQIRGIIPPTARSRLLGLFLPGLFCFALSLWGCGSEGGFSETGSLQVERHGHVALLLKDGSVLVLGGLTKTRPLASGERFFPAEGEFRRVKRRLPRPSGWAAAARLPDGRALYVGGWLDVQTVLSNAALYLPNTGEITPTQGRLSSPRFDHTVTPLADGSLLIAGGNNGSEALSFTERYLPDRDRFVPSRRMLSTRQLHTATPLPDGRVLIVGGNPKATYG